MKITIELTDEQFAQYKNKEEIIGMVQNYANSKIEYQYEKEFKKLSIEDKKLKISLPVKEESI